MLALGRYAPARAAGNELVFQAIGDFGWGNDKQKQVAAAMAKIADAHGCDFVISVGDNFYPNGVASTDDPIWKTHFEDIYAAPALQVPWHVAIGNHDYDGSVQAQIDYSKISWRWRMPSHLFKVSRMLADGTAADFFFTDTHPINRAYRNWLRFVYFPPGEQVAWLARELAASKAEWKIVIGHHPVFSGGGHGNTPGLIDQFKPLFERYGVQAYLNGHNHNLEHVAVNGVNYLTSGAGAEPVAVSPIKGSLFGHEGLGFMEARITREQMTVEFFGDDAKSLHRATIPRSAADGRRGQFGAGQRAESQRIPGALSRPANLVYYRLAAAGFHAPIRRGR
jgi:acid phosphatase